MSTVNLHAPDVTPEWAPDPVGTDGELRLWSTDLVVIDGPIADIRALLARALDLIPTRKGERE